MALRLPCSPMSTPPRPQGPRKQGPKKKANVKVPPSVGGGSDNRRVLMIVAAGSLIAIAIIAAYFVFAGGGSGASANAPELLQAAGCNVQTVKALKSNDHSVLTPGGISKKWNTSPPTSGPHYAVPAVWGSYTEPLNPAQLVHNLEHGGVYILYGKDVRPSTIQQLRSFYDEHQNATILAPLPSLGNRIALGAWTTKSAVQPNNGVAYLAKCPSFDEKAFAAFFSDFQGKGPERFPMSSLTPGS